MANEPEISLDAVTSVTTQLLGEGSLDGILLCVCRAAVAHVPGADEASISLVESGTATTFGATSGLPAAADERQYEAGTGPCLDAALANQAVIVEDARTDDRWRHVLPAMAEDGVLSSLSIPLPVQGTSIGALNIYARRPAAFGLESVAVGERLASFGAVAVAVANAVSYAKVLDDARNMQLAMESRAVIEQAKGILMGRVGCVADAAFRMLVEQSQHENRKLRDIAAELVEQASTGGP